MRPSNTTWYIDSIGTRTVPASNAAPVQPVLVGIRGPRPDQDQKRQDGPRVPSDTKAPHAPPAAPDQSPTQLLELTREVRLLAQHPARIAVAVRQQLADLEPAEGRPRQCGHELC